MIVLLYIPIAVLLGWYNAHLVNTWVDWSKGRKIKHFWNGVVHCTFAAIVWIFTDFKTGLAIFPIARIFFNESYNFFHIPRQSIGYTSLEPKSILDKIEQKLFNKDGITPLIIYAMIIVILLTV